DQRAQRAGAAIKKATAAELRHEAFDLVLCDVPCSGSGAWRRVIDSKWSLTPQKLDDLVAVQRGIVQSARAYLRPGGRFAYMTCSLFSLENSAQAGWITDTLAMPCIAQRQMTPLDGGDGFFVSTFQG
ncbi:MAG: RsmB/NOP family class I SAM-dependent RNA methyltransferase, partial [Pseudomonadota bacterium]